MRTASRVHCIGAAFVALSCACASAPSVPPSAQASAGPCSFTIEHAAPAEGGLAVPRQVVTPTVCIPPAAARGDSPDRHPANDRGRAPPSQRDSRSTFFAAPRNAGASPPPCASTLVPLT